MIRRARALVLGAVAIMVAVSTAVALAESYRAQYEWAAGHEVPPGWAAVWPAMIDTFIVVGEAFLFVAMIDRWNARARVYPWSVIAVGLAASVAANVGHVHAPVITDRLTAAVPPIAAAAALTLGMGILKRVMAPSAADPAAEASAADRDLAALVAELDTRTAVAALMSAGIGDTAELAAIVDVTPHHIRRLKREQRGQETCPPMSADTDIPGPPAAALGRRDRTARPRTGVLVPVGDAP